MKYNLKEYKKFTDLLINKANDKLAKKTEGFQVGIRLDKVPHFIDRLYDRDIQPEAVRDIVYSLINNHLCELIYAICLPDNYVRIDLQHNNTFIGATLNSTRTKLVFRTIVQDRHHPGIQKEYIINVK